MDGNLEQVKQLLRASKNTKIHMQLVFALLMGLRRGKMNGLKYSDVDFERHKLRIRRQLGDQRKEVMIVNIVKSAKYFAVLPCGKNGSGDLIRVIAVLTHDFRTYGRKK